MDLNKVMLIGRLTRDPEARTTPQGVAVTNFSIATSRVWKDDQGTQKENTEFHNVVAWRRLAEICAQYLTKGKQIYLEGHLQTRSWEGQDKQKRYRTEVVADNMIMLGSRGEGSSPAQASRPAQKQTATPAPAMAMSEAQPTSDEEIRIEDIPF
ncbi:MAG: single-stranded DNA-binding protein [Candidatus Andersenbacteria bacterium]|nr:single-stranded DNA-binding protein [Candidatus Andersenbacteria bacterium]MBI3251181.1 single-stranded DNA-binding protein [Candidatus Andersenbacteria bacterium]